MPKSIITNFNTDISFWESNPQMKIIFNEFYEKDSSKNKMESSKIMWGISLLVDPNESNSFRHISYTERLDEIKTGFFKDKKFPWVEHYNTIEIYKNHVLTKPELTLHVMERKLEERIKLLNDTPLTLENVELIDKVQLNLTKIEKELKELRKMVKDEDSNVKAKGDKKLGMLDSGQF